MEEDHKWGVAGKPGEVRQHQQPSKLALRGSWRDLSGAAVCIVLSVLCVGVCVVVFVRTSELQSRIASLEQQQRDSQLPVWMRSAEQVDPVVLGRLDQILDEVSAFMQPKSNVLMEMSFSFTVAATLHLVVTDEGMSHFVIQF